MNAPTRILVVEDEGVVAKDLQVRLRKLGYDVPVTVPTGEAAIEAAHEFNPDLILMDIRLKGDIDGIETSKRIMERSRTPVIFLTAYADENTLGRAKLTEPYGFILKPFNERELHTAIQVALHRHSSEAALRRSERWLSGTLRGIREAIIAVDQDRQVLFMNPAAQTLTGWTEAEATGKPLADVFQLVHSKSGDTLEAAVERSFQPPGPPDAAYLPSELEDAVLISRNGERTPVEDNAAPILNDDGEVAGGVLVFRDITHRKQVEEAQRASENQLRTLANSISHLAWMAEPDGNISWFNKRWYEYTGGSPNEPAGMGWGPVHHPQHADQVVARWKHSIDTGTMFDMEFPLRRADGEFRWFLTRAIPVSDERGVIIRWFGTNTDIHEARENLQHLQRANMNLAQFAYSASHDLREPIRNVALFSEILREQYSPVLDEKGVEFVGVIRDGATRMEKLVRDLLTYAESTSAYAQQPVEAVSCAEALDKARKGLTSLIASSGAEISAGSLPTLQIREMHLIQLLQNLIENAIKYKSEKTPSIEVSAEASQGQWIISVKDNGIGIDPLYHQRVFELFQRLHRGAEAQGTGLGLALCRNIVELYGGRIWVESEPGRGSTFRFSVAA